jgi:DNA replication and repair protein RecF
MLLADIKLLNFRSYKNLFIELPKEGCLFLGENGSGKTNFFEAVGICAMGKSVRNASFREIVSIEEKEASVSANFFDDFDKTEKLVGFSKNNEFFVRVNDIEHKSLSGLYGKNGFVYFGVDDIKTVKGIPQEKRQFIDMIISQKNTLYLQNIINYRNLIRQRNFVLSNNFNNNLIDVYDRQISTAALNIISERKLFFLEIIPIFEEIYKKISNEDLEICLQYLPSADCENEDEYYKILKENLNRDRELKFTALGTHRDNFEFRVGGVKLMNFGSQGQCKSAAISFKTAAVEYLSKEDKKTIVIIDDAFSDLDISRKRKFFDILNSERQIFIAVHSKKELDYYNIDNYFEIKKGEMKCFRK